MKAPSVDCKGWRRGQLVLPARPRRVASEEAQPLPMRCRCRSPGSCYLYCCKSPTCRCITNTDPVSILVWALTSQALPK